MVPEINWLAVVVATLSTMVIGSIWYTPKVFGDWWSKAARIETPANGLIAIPIAVLAGFLTSWVLAGAAAIAHHFYGGSFLANSVVTAVILWVGLTGIRFVTHDTFENRPPRLTLLTLGNELVTFVVVALIIGLFGISGA